MTKKSFLIAMAMTVAAQAQTTKDWTEMSAAMDGKPRVPYTGAPINWCRANQDPAVCTVGVRPPGPGFWAVANAELTAWVAMHSIPSKLPGSRAIKPGENVTCAGEKNDPQYWQLMYGCQ